MFIENHEEEAIELINRLNPYNCHRLIGHGFSDQTATEVAWMIAQERSELVPNPIKNINDLEDMGFDEDDIDNLYYWAMNEVAVLHKEKLDKYAAKHTAKTMNRTRYLPEPVLFYREFTRKFKDGSEEVAERWHFHMMLRSAGLLGLMVEDIYGKQEHALAVQLVNMLPKKVNPNTGEELSSRREIPIEQWVNANNHNLAVSAEKTAWNMRHRSWEEHLLKCFPNAPWLSAYARSLNSPVLPDGYFPKIPITFCKLTDSDGNDLGTDGSGLWNVDHPVFEKFISRHGICGWQIRTIHPRHGIFAKGAMRPVSLGQDAPAFIMDWNQIKGLKKNDAMKHRELNTEFVQKGMYVGCMQVWNKPRATLKSCFEMLENIQVNKETTTIIKELVDEAFAKLAKKGTDYIISQIASDDPRIAQTVQLVNKLRQYGVDIKATQIPMVQRAMRAKLEKMLWHIAQGAGISYKQRLCILDRTVEPGTIVATGVKPGTTITTFRFPMVLAQGLRTLTAVAPKPHMLCRGKPVQCMVFMHPDDLTTCMQGDDDGDIVGISTDERMVELFKYLVDHNIYHIEPEGKKIWLNSNSQEGLEYLRLDQTGPVGLATVFRSKLLAVGDTMGANALSITIQECVDAPKRRPEWSDFQAAANIKNWTQDENGEYHFDIRFKPEDLEDGSLPLELMAEWVEQRLIDHGCVTTAFQNGEEKIIAANATAWRWPGKRINLNQWVPTSSRSPWKGGNLVHVCHDYAYERFLPLRDMFQLDEPAINMSLLLPMMLATNGITANILCEDWRQYNNTLRRKSGLRQFGTNMHKIRSNLYDSSDQDKYHQQIDNTINQLYKDLEKADLSIDEIVTIWVMETSRVNPETGLPEESGLNNAFRVMSVPNNKVLIALGIDKPATCKWMHQKIKTSTGVKTRLEIAVETSMKQNNPQEHLAEAIYSDTYHHDECHDEDGRGIHLYQCKTCIDTVTDLLVRKIRSNKKSSETRWLAETMKKMNKTNVP